MFYADTVFVFITQRQTTREGLTSLKTGTGTRARPLDSVQHDI